MSFTTFQEFYFTYLPWLLLLKLELTHYEESILNRDTVNCYKVWVTVGSDGEEKVSILLKK